MNAGKVRKSHVITVMMVANIILAAALTLAISTITTENPFEQTRDQGTSHEIECGSGVMPLNVGCQNTDSQIQGDESSLD